MAGTLSERAFGHFPAPSSIVIDFVTRNEQLPVPPAAAQRPTKAAGWEQTERFAGFTHAWWCIGRAEAFQHTHDAVSTSHKKHINPTLTSM
jgi:hypothetical protein